jgi:hypothetical protein
MVPSIWLRGMLRGILTSIFPRRRITGIKDHLGFATQQVERANKGGHNTCEQANSREEQAINTRVNARLRLTEVTSVTTVDGKRPPIKQPRVCEENLHKPQETLRVRRPSHTPQILRRLPLKYYILYGISVFGIRTVDLLYSVYICTTNPPPPYQPPVPGHQYLTMIRNNTPYGTQYTTVQQPT